MKVHPKVAEKVLKKAESLVVVMDVPMVLTKVNYWVARKEPSLERNLVVYLGPLLGAKTVVQLEKKMVA